MVEHVGRSCVDNIHHRRRGMIDGHHGMMRNDFSRRVQTTVHMYLLPVIDLPPARAALHSAMTWL